MRPDEMVNLAFVMTFDLAELAEQFAFAIFDSPASSAYLRRSRLVSSPLNLLPRLMRVN